MVICRCGFPILLVLCLVDLQRTDVRADPPAEALLKLVPSDVGVTLVFEDFRSEAREFLESPLVAEFRRLPVVESWMDSGGRRRFQQARAQIEVAFNTTLEEMRDELFGDAVVLALRPAPESRPEEARGLLLTRVREPALLAAVIRRLNAIETADGTLEAVGAATHQGVRYQVRRFVPGTKADEAYVLLGESTFAWSNSEALIRDVIDRHRNGGRESLGARPEFQAVRDGLPSEAVACLYIDPRFLERSRDFEAPDGGRDPLQSLLARYLASVEYAGAALVARDGLALYTHERLDPDGLDEPLRRWAAGSTADLSPLLQRIPPDAPIRAAAHVDVPALFDLGISLVPEDQRPRIEPILALATGLLLGRDVRGEVLPALGPRMVAYVDAPERSTNGDWPPPLVLAVALSGEGDDPRGIPAAIDNALRSLFAVSTFDAPAGSLRVRTHQRQGVRVTELVGSPLPLAFVVTPEFVALGTSLDSVAAFADDSRDRITRGTDKSAGPPSSWPDASTFVEIDLDAVVDLARAHRDALVRGIAGDQQADEADVGRDLDRALALLGLFRSASAAQRIAPDFRSVDRRLELIGRSVGGSAP